jgi:hypothetical protein
VIARAKIVAHGELIVRQRVEAKIQSSRFLKYFFSIKNTTFVISIPVMKFQFQTAVDSNSLLAYIRHFSLTNRTQ